MNIVNKFNVPEIKNLIKEFVEKNVFVNGYDEETRKKCLQWDDIIGTFSIILFFCLFGFSLFLFLLNFKDQISSFGIPFICIMCLIGAGFVSFGIYLFYNFISCVKMTKNMRINVIKELENISNTDYEKLINLIGIIISNHNYEDKSDKITSNDLKIIQSKVRDYFLMININERSIKKTFSTSKDINFEYELDNGNIENYAICCDEIVKNTKINGIILEFYNDKIILIEPYMKGEKYDKHSK